MGQKDPYRMRYTAEIYRWFMPMFLHGSLGHLLSNVISQIIIGSILEADMGAMKFLSLYILSGMGGILFSAFCTDDLSMGASTAVFGLVGSYVAFIIINCESLKSQPERFCQIACFAFLAFFLSLMLGAGVS